MRSQFRSLSLVAYDEQGRRYLRAVGAVPLVIAAAVVGALLLWLMHATSASGSTSSDGRSQHATTPTACMQALDNANAAMRDVRTVEAALTTQLRVMNDLLALRISTGEALGQSLPALTRASQQSLQLDQDAAAYAGVASACRSAAR